MLGRSVSSHAQASLMWAGGETHSICAQKEKKRAIVTPACKAYVVSSRASLSVSIAEQ